MLIRYAMVFEFSLVREIFFAINMLDFQIFDTVSENVETRDHLLFSRLGSWIKLVEEVTHNMTKNIDFFFEFPQPSQMPLWTLNSRNGLAELSVDPPPALANSATRRHLEPPVMLTSAVVPCTRHVGLCQLLTAPSDVLQEIPS